MIAERDFEQTALNMGVAVVRMAKEQTEMRKKYEAEKRRAERAEKRIERALNVILEKAAEDWPGDDSEAIEGVRGALLGEGE